ncbi:hypothetical protein MKEN_00580400 [Mycena kentingensis (nom. inval.)]|nr:hypothetical protein MKEN_00580400 [Mycena kentingensis (nom. inval.)]
MVFNTKSLLVLAASAFLAPLIAAQTWTATIYEASAGGTSSCTGGGTRFTSASFSRGECITVGLGSNAVGFRLTTNPPSVITASLFSDNNCGSSIGSSQTNNCHAGTVNSFIVN